MRSLSRYDDANETLHAGLARSPDESTLLNLLARKPATAPDARERNGASAAEQRRRTELYARGIALRLGR